MLSVLGLPSATFEIYSAILGLETSGFFSFLNLVAGNLVMFIPMQQF